MSYVSSDMSNFKDACTFTTSRNRVVNKNNWMQKKIENRIDFITITPMKNTNTIKEEDTQCYFVNLFHEK